MVLSSSVVMFPLLTFPSPTSAIREPGRTSGEKNVALAIVLAAVPLEAGTLRECVPYRDHERVIVCPSGRNDCRGCLEYGDDRAAPGRDLQQPVTRDEADPLAIRREERHGQTITLLGAGHRSGDVLTQQPREQLTRALRTSADKNQACPVGREGDRSPRNTLRIRAHVVLPDHRLAIDGTGRAPPRVRGEGGYERQGRERRPD